MTLMERLRDATRSSYHEFWPDDVSLLDPQVANAGWIRGLRQLTDVYLLALALRRGGRFVTFDATVPITPVPGAERNHLLAI